MGPLRFERRSEDPQSPRMVQATLWPRLIVLVYFLYVSSFLKLELLEFNIFKFFNILCQLFDLI